MSLLMEESLFNTSVVFLDVVLSRFSNIVLYAIGLTSNVSEGWTYLSALSLLDWQALFSYDDFQVILLKVFLFILAFNIVSICIAWRVYGKNIYETFMKPGELQSNHISLLLLANTCLNEVYPFISFQSHLKS